MTSSLAERINELFDVLHGAQDPERPESAVAEQVSHRCGQDFPVQVLRELRSGVKRSAPAPQLKALAEAFGVSPGFLTDPSGDDTVAAQLRLLRALRDHGVRNTSGLCRRLVSNPGGVDEIDALTALIVEVGPFSSP